MENVVKMAGNFAAHAILSVSDGETLIPIVGLLDAEDQQSMRRMVMGSVEALAAGEHLLNNFTPEYKGAAFIKDGLVTLETGKTDSLIVDIRFSDDSAKKIQFLIPYRNANHEKGFAVHRLKISEATGFSQDEFNLLADAFFDGLESHPEGGKIWNEKYVDQAGVSTGHYGEENTEFSNEDFEKLKQAPFLIFFLVAAADGSIDKKEVREFMEVLSNPEILNNPLLNRIITNVINQIPSVISDMATKEIDYISELAQLKFIADSSLPDDQANHFKISLLLLGKKIAEASGGFFGFGSKISKEEKGALAAIAVCLGIRA
ncbi:hypothetical protein GCM10008090_10250 [Arenicella chitinivorans]|uniref:Tellurite resistance protein TerB n=1 Tax=Arenicella chitinivorans TaxID=1329800 RepID=A0A918RMM7_9GAMM|nr:hypothetical protein [Arenicella chitinivorans]GHA03212.1 hypothetical protein GCM10008090_10250 [Arenicella chitinivorans]